MILLVVDTQKGIMNQLLYQFEQVKNNIVVLIEEARKNGIEVVYVRHDDGDGSKLSVGNEEFEIFERKRL